MSNVILHNILHYIIKWNLLYIICIKESINCEHKQNQHIDLIIRRLSFRCFVSQGQFYDGALVSIYYMNTSSSSNQENVE